MAIRKTVTYVIKRIDLLRKKENDSSPQYNHGKESKHQVASILICCLFYQTMVAEAVL